MDDLIVRIFNNTASEEEILSFFNNLDNFKLKEKELLAEWSKSSDKLDSKYSEDLFKKIETKVKNIEGGEIKSLFKKKNVVFSGTLLR